MNKKRITFLILGKRYIALFLMCTGFVFQYASANEGNGAYKKKVTTIVVDPGHGGRDPGALGKNSKEKDIVLAISKQFGEYVNEHYPEVKVVFTRDSDQFVPLHERADIANKLHADLFISIHANANPKTSPYGAETYIMGPHANEMNLEVAKKENSVITLEEDYKTNYEGFDPSSTESYIAFTFVQNTYLTQSLNFASYIQDEFASLHRYNRGVKQAGFLVLWRTTMPSVLVEVGFISNEKEEQYLMSKSGQDSLAYAIFKAFRDYKSVIESQSLFDTEDDEPVLFQGNNQEKAPSRLSSATKLSGSDKNIRFKVQVTVSSKSIELTDEIFKGYDNVEQFELSGVYKYAVGHAFTYDEISDYCNKVKNDFPDAFIIAVKNNEIIPVKTALKELQK